MHGLDNQIAIDSQTDCDLTTDSDSAVVLEDCNDSECNSLSLKRKSCSNDVVRSISDVIQMPRRTNLQKSNCYLRRPDILETVYSVEEDPDALQSDQKQQQEHQSSQNDCSKNQTSDVAEKRDKFRNRTDKRISDIGDDTESFTSTQSCTATFWEKLTSYYDYASRGDSRSSTPIANRRRASDDDAKTSKQQQNQVTNFNRVMSNHRNFQKPKDVKYKRINKAKSKSLEELRVKLKNFVDHRSTGSYNLNNFQSEKSRDDV